MTKRVKVFSETGYLILDSQFFNLKCEICNLQLERLVSPEMVKIELCIACIKAEMIRYKLLHRFLSSLSLFKINPL